MKVLEAVGTTRAAPCGVVCATALSLMYSSMHPLRGCVNRIERTLLNFFVWSGVRGGYFGVSEGCFADEIWGSGEARMGRFAAEFCGFWAARGCGAAIQRTADSAGRAGRKNF